MADRRTSWVQVAFLLLAGSMLLLGVPYAAAEPEDGKPPEKPKGPAYKNAEVGLTANGPSGWKMAKDKPKSVEWTRLVTWYDPKTNSDAVLSRRPRTSRSVNAMLGRVQKEWRQTPELTVTSMRAIERNAMNPIPTVIVDATTVVKRKAKRPEDPPPPPLTYRISATYYLAPKAELLLYVKAQATHWSRVRGAVRDMRNSIKFEGSTAEKGPQGEGAYRNDRLGFACQYPPGYAVVTPARSAHVVQFEGIAVEQPVIGVYRIQWDAGVAKDVERMVAYYKDELAGEAETRSIQVGSRSGTMITARANVGGRDQTFYVVFLKRGGEIWRLKASMPQAQEGPGMSVFKAFLGSFRLGAAPR
ncbi:MAG: hypothetical protein QNJ98_11045 [Planctomycetota bacterium]|nr:hypothetical protein [Planctomycetota bacterium]